MKKLRLHLKQKNSELHLSMHVRQRVFFGSMNIRILFVFLCLLCTATADAQLKTPRAPSSPTLTIKPSDVDYQLWESFQVVRKANDGDPLAQHELGLRYLTGRGFFADTAKAVHWLQKAADQDLPVANFNLAILLSNGWGLPWNPFLAFRRFSAAATRGMPDALYAVGISYTEDLIVPADWMKAQEYLQRAAQAGSEAGKSALEEFTRRGLFEKHGRLSSSPPVPPADTLRPKVPPLMLQDFESDSLAAQPEQLDLLTAKNAVQLRNLLGIERDEQDSTRPALELIRTAAEYGSPEARILLGRCYETGTGMPKDLLRASEEYLNALRLDAPRAYDLLWALLSTPGFREAFEAGSRQESARPKFISAGLAGIRLDLQMTEQNAVQLLQEASARGHIPAKIELGIRYSSGRGVPRDRERAFALWREAAQSGSREAEIRLAMARVLEGGSDGVRAEDVQFLTDAAEHGSVLGQLALGFCRERGIGMKEDRGEAARQYRKAARRGNQAAYLSLRHMHDEIRPAEPEFLMP